MVTTVIRPLQAAAIDELRARVRAGARRIVTVAPTGFGKTVVIGAIVAGHLSGSPDTRVLVVVHRRELVRQTVAKLRAAGVDNVDVLQAGSEVQTGARVVVASVQTLVARGDRPPATLVIWDECHHCPAASFREVYGAYSTALHLGFTASPARADGKAIGDMYETMVVGASVGQLTALGLLVPSEVLCLGEPTRDLALDPVAAYQRHTPGRPAVVFATSVAHARALVPQFETIGVRAACIDGEMSADDRDAALARFAAGEVDALCNVFCLVEGWDAPRAEVCILARCPEHVAGYLQMVGRVLRTAPGKRIATVLDLRGAALLHGLPDEQRSWSLTGAACTRTEAMTALQRCKECLAIYRPQRTCPRCGARHEVTEKIPRVLRRAEKLQRLNDVPPRERDRAYLRRLVSIAEARMRMPRHRAEQWAVTKFEKSFGRKPELAA